MIMKRFLTFVFCAAVLFAACQKEPSLVLTGPGSIELSADAPIREPYAVYFQGGLTWPHAKLGIMKSLQQLVDEDLVLLGVSCHNAYEFAFPVL